MPIQELLYVMSYTVCAKKPERGLCSMGLTGEISEPWYKKLSSNLKGMI